MPKSIQVHLLPELVSPDLLQGKIVVVIDVLRASTTITTALAAGACEVVPCLEVDDARRVAAELGDSVLLGGERDGVRIDGFDLGNSPADYTRDVVAGKTIVFTTTNGTKAMQRCRKASLIVVGSFVNLSAVFELLVDRQEVVLLCAGTRGEITAEDALFAGAVANRLVSNVATEVELNDQARLARDAWRHTVDREFELAQVLRQSQGGRNVARIGLSADIDFAAQIDAFEIVPQLDVRDWRIHVP